MHHALIRESIEQQCQNKSKHQLCTAFSSILQRNYEVHLSEDDKA